MPYIEEHKRQNVLTTYPINPGELNYVITQACINYLQKNHIGPNYVAFNEVIGALECAKLEFYRRAVAPYEDIKIAQNGDVYKG